MRSAETKMELGLKSKVAGITGSANGIGKAIAEKFAVEGCRVLLCDVNEEMLGKTEKEFRQKGYEVFAGRVDVTDQREIDDFISRACTKYGSVDIWVNNAGIYPQKEILDMTAEEWDRLFNINLKSVFLCTKSAVGWMKRRQTGVIINAASFAALIPSAGSGGYAATKAAVLSMTRTLAAELAPFGIRVNAYVPGVIETPMTQGVIEKKHGGLLSQIALHRLGQPGDVANAIVFLASDAAGYISGTYLEISGGKLCVQNPDFGWEKQEL